jgi:uncharacterized protein (TIGR02117 family)
VNIKIQKTLSLGLILLSLFLTSSCVTFGPTIEIPTRNTDHIIYFAFRHWHTSVIVETKRFSKQNPKLLAALDDQKYLRIGWGDGDYFTGKSKTFGAATKALVASSYSAVQMLTYSEQELREIPRETILPLAISDRGMRLLLNYIEESIAVDEHGNVLRLPSLAIDTGIFFKARGHYSVFSNCNTWSAQALRIAGLPVASRLTAQNVFKQARKISDLQREAGLFNAL